MTKKKIDKKKINIKLESGQTYLVVSVDEMLSISTALVHHSAMIKNSTDRAYVLDLNKKVLKSMSENSFIGGFLSEEDWD